MRKTFLDNLPVKGSSRINWAKSEGLTIPFIYDEVEGEVIIEKYIDNENIILYYPPLDKYLKISGGHIKEAKIGVILNKRKKPFEYNINDVIKDEKRDIKILDILTKQRRYKCICNKDGHIWTTHKDAIEKLKTGCPVCANQVAALGINTIWDTDRWMVNLGVSEYDAKKYTKCSSRKIEVVCPDCENTKDIRISDIYKYKSIGCKKCGDGVSYAEKFMSSVLVQLGVDFKAQLSKTTFKWCDNKRYDFYLPDYNMIIETHGEQHYKETGFKTSLVEIQENDRFKRELALTNGIEHYIVIDCRKSEFDWITFNVYKKLKDHFDMSNVDFSKAEEFALGNVIKEICDYWNNKEDWETTQTIADIFNISKNTIIKYLEKGNILGWCKYSAKEEKSKASKKLNKANGKQIDVFDLDMNYINSYKNARDLERKSLEDFNIFIGYRGVSQVCNYNKKSYKGFIFRFKNDDLNVE